MDDHDIPLGEDIELGEKQQIALEYIRSTGASDSDVARAARIDRSTLYRWKQDPAFLGLYKAARQVGIEQLVAEAERRAMRGSDRLLEFLLCNYAPDRFQKRETRDLNHAGITAFAVISGVPEEGEDLV
jgi:transposase-like protein